MEYTKIAVDAMGGDNAPFETVKGAVLAVKDNDKIKIFLTGPKDTVEKELAQYEYDSERISVIDAPEIITNDESPVNAIRQKKNSSLVEGFVPSNRKSAMPSYRRAVREPFWRELPP